MNEREAYERDQAWRVAQGFPPNASYNEWLVLNTTDECTCLCCLERRDGVAELPCADPEWLSEAVSAVCWGGTTLRRHREGPDGGGRGGAGLKEDRGDRQRGLRPCPDGMPRGTLQSGPRDDRHADWRTVLSCSAVTSGFER